MRTADTVIQSLVLALLIALPVAVLAWLWHEDHAGRAQERAEALASARAYAARVLAEPALGPPREVACSAYGPSEETRYCSVEFSGNRSVYLLCDDVGCVRYDREEGRRSR